MRPMDATKRCRFFTGASAALVDAIGPLTSSGPVPSPSASPGARGGPWLALSPSGVRGAVLGARIPRVDGGLSLVCERRFRRNRLIATPPPTGRRAPRHRRRRSRRATSPPGAAGRRRGRRPPSYGPSAYATLRTERRIACSTAARCSSRPGIRAAAAASRSATSLARAWIAATTASAGFERNHATHFSASMSATSCAAPICASCPPGTV